MAFSVGVVAVRWKLRAVWPAFAQQLQWSQSTTPATTLVRSTGLHAARCVFSRAYSSDEFSKGQNQWRDVLGRSSHSVGIR